MRPQEKRRDRLSFALDIIAMPALALLSFLLFGLLAFTLRGTGLLIGNLLVYPSFLLFGTGGVMVVLGRRLDASSSRRMAIPIGAALATLGCVWLIAQAA